LAKIRESLVIPTMMTISKTKILRNYPGSISDLVLLRHSKRAFSLAAGKYPQITNLKSF
jgi:hypothetical protein